MVLKTEMIEEHKRSAAPLTCINRKQQIEAASHKEFLLSMATNIQLCATKHKTQAVLLETDHIMPSQPTIF